MRFAKRDYRRSRSGASAAPPRATATTGMSLSSAASGPDESGDADAGDRQVHARASQPHHAAESPPACGYSDAGNGQHQKQVERECGDEIDRAERQGLLGDRMVRMQELA